MLDLLCCSIQQSCLDLCRLPGCDATALAGSEFWLTEKMRAYSHGEPHPKWFNPNKYLNRAMSYASAVAEARHSLPATVRER